MLKETGALISLQPNASKIITKWGLDPILQRVAEPQADKAFRMFNAEGKLVREIPLSTNMFGADRMMYHRQDLHAALREAATTTEHGFQGKPAAVIKTAADVVDCDPAEGHVKLKDGTTLEADLIIGADGIKSVIRKCVVGEERTAQPTGLSAYRMLIPAAKLPIKEIPEGILRMEDPAATTMIVGKDKRVIMGPGRGGKLLGIVALVPDEPAPDAADDSWTRPGSKQELLAAFADFPSWLRAIFDQAEDDEIGLWQLRDIDPLPTWTKGRAVLIGDAAHAMLPTQGQGASQAVEDAEALQAFLAELGQGPVSKDQVERALGKVFKTRYERASLIQAYSREQARPGTAGREVTLDPAEFMKFNCEYQGAIDWLGRQTEEGRGPSDAKEPGLVKDMDKLKLVDARS
jgi:salicylate hydroxylase